MTFIVCIYSSSFGPVGVDNKGFFFLPTREGSKHYYNGIWIALLYEDVLHPVFDSSNPSYHVTVSKIIVSYKDRITQPLQCIISP